VGSRRAQGPALSNHADGIADLYERRARDYDRDRGRSLQERAWLDRFLEGVPPDGVVLDLGCGMGEPIAAYVLGTGRAVIGVDSSPSLLALARARFPRSEWLEADMRALALGRRVDGILAWDSFFHLPPDDQRQMFGVFAAHAASGARLMFTSGPSAGESIGSFHGEPLYHASLDQDEYRSLLASHGFAVDAFVQEDPACGNHTIWLATHSS
jgi:SAM-dependent methyltransferase